ncbi:HAD family hydrolase [Dactylosporangium matsuzakiense]|uniref:Haloacid dehalogenase n=1 Tax=Dactylosporangium matsuzakiense TaxID=53360 RepID=A0A9W6KSH7_9ACTN|nr:haloacid dehalogenase-like hydrolase [Dactylosporangium matsuzakiense]UWZ44681.1 haloacid dehalogenase-like hydrolase [Dactylosporangium matsuzakiense]GLL04704.1 haloacid dehalogenase [Dactylosporangium matsuzakiense]
MIASGSGRRLILWDIDHTLIETRGVGGELYANAFRTATGTPMVHKAAVTGQTEPSILTATLRLHGIAEDEPYLSRYVAALPAEYDRHRADLAERGRVLPGAQQILAALAGRPELVQSVLTGNLRDVARIKLEVFDLHHYLDLEAGAFGDDNTDRPKLVAIAQRRASAKYGTVFDRDTTAVIGDSSHDINTGLQGGAHAAGVASGSESVEQLRAAGAATAWPDLNDTAAIEVFLLSLPR